LYETTERGAARPTGAAPEQPAGPEARSAGAAPDPASPAALEDALRRLLRQVAHAGWLMEAHDHGGVRVSPSEVLALGELSEATVLSQGELAGRLGLEKSTVSRLAAGMERRGWLARERDPGNRRLYRLRLTADGRDAAGRVGDDLRARHGALLAELTQAERAGLALGLAGLIRAFQVHLDSWHHAAAPDGEAG
jgi:DNA-binding MarR family transcriptional regulator